MKDVDEGTFVRFLEYLNTDGYTAAKHAVVVPPVVETEEDQKTDTTQGKASSNKEDIVQDDVEVPPQDTKASSTGFRQRFPTNDSPLELTAQKKDHMYDPFVAAPYTSPAQDQDLWTTFLTRTWPNQPTYGPACRANEGPDKDYSEVFLSHAKVYVSADKYNIEALRSLALRNLHKIFSIFTLHPESVANIATLFQYVYQHTLEREIEIDPLLELVVNYVACKVEKLVSDEVFKGVLREENSASIDVMKMLLQRLH